jgi:uncharacterized delta-60 repeat protein
VATANFGGSRGDFANAVAIQSDGKIVAVGRRDNVSIVDFGDQGDFAIARFNADGTLDKSFSGDGKQTIDFNRLRASRFANAVVIQPDGRIVVAGQDDVHSILNGIDTDYDFALARLLTKRQARPDLRRDPPRPDGDRIAIGQDHVRHGRQLRRCPDDETRP